MRGVITVLVFLILAILAGCATTPVARHTCPQIPNPDPPERFAWKTDGETEKEGIIYLDPYRKVQPKEKLRAPDNGGVLLTSKAWRGVRHGLVEWPRWGDMIQGIIREHNEKLSGYREKDRGGERWWKFWE